MHRFSKNYLLILICSLVGLGFTTALSGQDALRPQSAAAAHAEHLKQELTKTYGERDKLNAMVKEATVQLDTLQVRRQKSLSKQDQLGISSESFPQIIRMLQSQRVELTIDLAGLNARRLAMSLELKKLQDLNTSDNPELIAKLSQLVDIQKREYEQLNALAKSNAVSPNQVTEARKNLLEAEIRLRQVQAPMRTAITQDLAQQLQEVSLDRAEKKARFEKIEELLVQFASARTDIDEIEELHGQLDKTRKRLVMLRKNLTNVESMVNRYKTQLDQIENADEE